MIKSQKKSGKILLVTLLGLLIISGGEVFARKGLLSSRAKGMASVEIKGADLDKVKSSLKEVFIGDGFAVVEEGPTVIIFEKIGERRHDLSYGGLQGGTTIVQARVYIDKVSELFYEVGCDVTMIKNPGDNDREDSTDVLKLFGREYQRMLRQAKRKAQPGIR